MQKIFYDPKTLKIKGMSTGDGVLANCDFVTSKVIYHAADRLYIEIVKGKPKLKIKE